jgi:hypothetical protein
LKNPTKGFVENIVRKYVAHIVHVYVKKTIELNRKYEVFSKPVTEENIVKHVLKHRNRFKTCP